MNLNTSLQHDRAATCFSWQARLKNCPGSSETLIALHMQKAITQRACSSTRHAFNHVPFSGCGIFAHDAKSGALNSQVYRRTYWHHLCMPQEAAAGCGCTRLYADRIHGDAAAMQAIIKVLH